MTQWGASSYGDWTDAEQLSLIVANAAPRFHGEWKPPGRPLPSGSIHASVMIGQHLALEAWIKRTGNLGFRLHRREREPEELGYANRIDDQCAHVRRGELPTGAMTLRVDVGGRGAPLAMFFAPLVQCLLAGVGRSEFVAVAAKGSLAKAWRTLPGAIELREWVLAGFGVAPEQDWRPREATPEDFYG